MKWKRSKKAQQEARGGGGGSANASAKSEDSGVSSRCSTERENIGDAEIRGSNNSANLSNDESREATQEHSSRSIPDLQEPLYRPYVV